MRLSIALLLTLCATAPVCAQTKIIFDADIDTDCDDAGALAVLHALADRGEAEILATVVSSRYSWSVPCVEAINRYYGRADIPIGAPKTAWADTGHRGSPYAKQISEQFATRYKSNEDAPDAVDVYRRVLAAQDDGSVVIVTVGYLTNLRDLLASKPDAASPLDGPALIRKKVRSWVCTGGAYPKNLNPAVCGNYTPDPSSTVIAIRDWPDPIVFTGLGDDILTGSLLHTTPANNPVRRAYKLLLRDVKTRPSWDLIGVLVAVRSKADFWTIRTGGHYHIFDNGTYEWRKGPEKNHRVIELKIGSEKRLTETLDQLMIQAPKAK
jgi:inosine-uridine preferring nucleoside hydrolase